MYLRIKSNVPVAKKGFVLIELLQVPYVGVEAVASFGSSICLSQVDSSNLCGSQWVYLEDMYR